MHIYIPTYRRVMHQRTLTWLPRSWWPKVSLVVDKIDALEFEEYVSEHPNLVIVPKSVQTIAQKRAWIMRTTSYERILMLDDDLRFARRVYTENKFVLEEAKPRDVDWGLMHVERRLEHMAHVGIGARQGNNNVKEKLWKKNTRMMYALGYNIAKLQEADVHYGRIEHREDMDYTLQLLRKGYENAVLVDLTVDQTYNNKGGASLQRTIEASNADADKLAALHPGLVKVVEKDYAQSVPRKEVVCYWRNAYAKGLEWRDNRAARK